MARIQGPCQRSAHTAPSDVRIQSLCQWHVYAARICNPYSEAMTVARIHYSYLWPVFWTRAFGPYTLLVSGPYSEPVDAIRRH